MFHELRTVSLVIAITVSAFFMAGCNGDNPVGSDSGGKRIKRTEEYSAYGNLYLYVRTEYIYDDNGKLIETNGYNSSSDLVQKTIYNTQEQILSDTTYLKNGDWYSRTEYIYDSNGRISGINTYLADNSYISTVEYTYNSDGQIIWRKFFSFSYNPNVIGQPWYTLESEYTYNSKGEIQAIADTDQYGTKVFEYAYDSNGRILTISKDGIVTTKYEYLYDNAGNITKVSTFHFDFLSQTLVLDYYTVYIYERK